MLFFKRRTSRVTPAPQAASKVAEKATVDVAQPAKITVVTTMKDEGPYILDWVSHYKTLGATDIVVFTNDCTDPSDHILRQLNRLGVVHHRFSRVMRRGPYRSALMWAEEEPVVRNADWLLVVDVDEYLQINVGDGTFQGLIAANPAADAISFVWKIFGNADVAEIDNTPVPMAFERAQNTIGEDGEMRFFKTLYRNSDKFARMGVHRPILSENHDPIHWITADGKTISDDLIEKGQGVSENYGYDGAQLNHYALRSVEGFLNKQKRGRGYHVKGKLGLAYWNRFDKNDVKDVGLSENFEKATAYKDKLLEDEKLLEFHEGAFVWHKRMARRAKRKEPMSKHFLKARATENAENTESAGLVSESEAENAVPEVQSDDRLTA